VNEMENKIREISDCGSKIKRELSKIITGQEETVGNILVSLFSRGHVLIVGVPGLAKTLLVSSLSRILDLKFSRIQFTPDLMPSDITGYEILVRKEREEKAFEFFRGPVFANLVLADEINRAPSKTQSALLEAMQELSVTVAGESYPLPSPFMVFATQNPIEQEGTYNLPEAQLDRFFMQLNISYPKIEEEKKIAGEIPSLETAGLEKAAGAGEISRMQKTVASLPAADSVVDFAVRLAAETRPACSSSEKIKKYVLWGAGPRGSQYLVLAARARAALQGRCAPSAEDVKAVAGPALRHRIILNFQAKSDSVSADDIIKDIISR